MKFAAAFVISAPFLLAQAGAPEMRTVTAVRQWAQPDTTRVVIEISGDFDFRSDRLHDPERVYFDILKSRPHIDSRRVYTREFDDRLVKRVRVAETQPGTTRVVLDLSGNVAISSSQLTNPSRLMIELRPSGVKESPSAVAPAPTPAPATAKPDPPPKPDVVPVTPVKRSVPKESAAVKPEAPSKPRPTAPLPRLEVATVSPVPVVPEPQLSEPISAPPEPVQVSAKPEAPTDPPPAVTAKVEPPKTEARLPAEMSKAARHTSSGQNSLTRALGLKIGRIVIDPGHGGHDEGTAGPKGLLEKDLVLDIAQRLGSLIQDRLGADVIYTRTDDTFMPLEGRTALANEKKADLFLSIHANSSSFPRIAGVESYYLNFTDSKDSLDVAARENASSQKSVFELRDIIQKITLHDKAEESREFAGRVQAALFTFSKRSFPTAKNRGVKKAPFVVLIGASMPSVLAEIGFLSNPREEALLKKPDYRQKLAEALFQGVSRYAQGLSHFQVAQN